MVEEHVPPEWREIRESLEVFLPEGAGPFTLLSWTVKELPESGFRFVNLRWRCKLPRDPHRKTHQRMIHTYLIRHRRGSPRLVRALAHCHIKPSYAEGDWVEQAP